MTTPMLTRITTAWVFAAATLGGAARADAHGGHHNPVAWRACDAHPLGAQCSFLDGAHARHRGTCRSISGALLCVRNRPIEPAEPVEAVVSAAPAPSLDSVLVRLGAAIVVWLAPRSPSVDSSPPVTPL